MPPEKIIKLFDIRYSDIFKIYIMDSQLLETINYIRNLSKKKVTYILTMQEHQTGIKSLSRESWEKCRQTPLLMKTISLWLHCHQIITIFPSYRMMFVLHLRYIVTSLVQQRTWSFRITYLTQLLLLRI